MLRERGQPLGNRDLDGAGPHRSGPAPSGGSRRLRSASGAARSLQGAGRLPRLYRDPFDRMLIAQARAEQLALLTRDRAIIGYGAAGADVVTFDD